MNHTTELETCYILKVRKAEKRMRQLTACSDQMIAPHCDDTQKHKRLRADIDSQLAEVTELQEIETAHIRLLAECKFAVPNKLKMYFCDQPTCDNIPYMISRSAAVMTCPGCGRAVPSVEQTSKLHATVLTERIVFKPVEYIRCKRWHSLVIRPLQTMKRVLTSEEEVLLQQTIVYIRLDRFSARTQQNSSLTHVQLFNVVQQAARSLRVQSSIQCLEELTMQFTFILNNRKQTCPLTEQQEIHMTWMFILIERFFDQVRHAAQRTYFLDLNLVGYVVAGMLGMMHHLPHFVFAETKSALLEQTLLLRHIIKLAGWNTTFIESTPPI
jgi:hypothetical protein